MSQLNTGWCKFPRGYQSIKEAAEGRVWWGGGEVWSLGISKSDYVTYIRPLYHQFTTFSKMLLVKIYLTEWERKCWEQPSLFVWPTWHLSLRSRWIQTPQLRCFKHWLGEKSWQTWRLIDLSDGLVSMDCLTNVWRITSRTSFCHHCSCTLPYQILVNVMMVHC